MDRFVPVNEPRIVGNEKKYLEECIDTGWLSSEGPFVSRFEKAFADRVGRGHAVAVCNGTAALEAAVAALRLDDGDEIIVPTGCIISCVAAIVRNRLIPVLVDCEPDTWNLDVSRVESAITDRTRAIMAVHTFGLPVDIEPLEALAKEHGLFLIEDAAEVIGARYGRRECGNFGHISIMSFYANKHVTTGEGGMVFTDDDELARRVSELRNLCFKPGQRFVHESLGWNFRMSNLQAAVGLAQLECLDSSVEKKTALGDFYRASLADIPGLIFQKECTDRARNVTWVFGVLLDDTIPFDAKEAMRRLGDLRVGTRPFFWPMHRQPVFLKQGMFAGESHPVSERLGERCFYLPSGLRLDEDQAGYVAECVRKVFA